MNPKNLEIGKVYHALDLDWDAAANQMTGKVIEINLCKVVEYTSRTLDKFGETTAKIDSTAYVYSIDGIEREECYQELYETAGEAYTELVEAFERMVENCQERIAAEQAEILKLIQTIERLKEHAPSETRMV